MALAFGFLVLVSIAMAAIAALRARGLEVGARHLVGDMQANTLTLAQMERDIGLIRSLVDEHVVEKGAAAMAALDEQIRATKLDLAEAERTYELLAKTSAAEATWQQTKDTWSSMQEPLEQLLVLSRRNEDVQAREMMVGLTSRFDALSLDIDGLSVESGRAAEQAVARLGHMRRRTLATLVGTSVLEIVVIMVVAYFTLRLYRGYWVAMTRYLDGLEQRNRDLDAFAGHVAHDIRGPLNVISLASQRLNSQTPEAANTVAALRRGIGRMEALINDLLALASVGERMPGTSDPSVVADQLVEDFASRLESEHGTLRVKVEHSRVNGSEGLLRQALANLIDNAIKYRRADVAPQVDVTGRVVDGRYLIRVSDNGVGMSAEDARRVFEPLYRSVRARDVPGTGLGLSIVRRVVEASGGAVAIAQSSLEIGTTFEIQLSIAQPARVDEEAKAAGTAAAPAGGVGSRA